MLFSGGRGSGVLTHQLVINPSIALTIAINGYDDGASTGEVRRFLGDCLGPSDFRKNASRLAAELHSCNPALIEILDLRLPVGTTEADARRAFAAIAGSPSGGFDAVGPLVDRLEPAVRARVAGSLSRFAGELDASPALRSGASGPFNFSDCSLGNLVFAGMYLERSRDFNGTVDDYAALLGLPQGLIENVTDGTNAWLVGLDADGALLSSEEQIVDATRPNRIRDIFLVAQPIPETDRAAIRAMPSRAEEMLRAREVTPALNPRLAATLAAADLIIYAPGTQHSSLFPSYLTPGLSALVAGNLSAIKLLITNIQADAEITGSNAVDIIERAVYYLKEKGRYATPTPCLITHYLLNDPGRDDGGTPYVPLGPLESLEDPRLVRIGNYEEGVTGRHDAARVLAPFIESIIGRDRRKRVAVLLHDAGSINKVTQTLLEMVRGGIEQLPLDVTVFYGGADVLDGRFTSRLPFAVTALPGGDPSFAQAARGGAFDYVVLFESSGMYRGEDLVGLASHLAVGRLDAVWGSRRLSVRDIEESYRLRYRTNVLLGAISYAGSHVLSLAYLLLYGRYVSDTLSAVRAVRAADAFDPAIDLTDKNANHWLLSTLLRRKAELLEVPVQFFPLSPERVKRTSPLQGIQALATIVWRRFAAVRPVQDGAAVSAATPPFDPAHGGAEGVDAADPRPTDSVHSSR
ncbi:MAG: 2-phospho-L-lactate transferase CofD family protein [Acidobacteriota bacterium]